MAKQAQAPQEAAQEAPQPEVKKVKQMYAQATAKSQTAGFGSLRVSSYMNSVSVTADLQGQEIPEGLANDLKMAVDAVLQHYKL